MDDHTLAALHTELLKLAALSPGVMKHLRSMAGGVGSLAGAGAVAGGAIGAGVSGVRGYQRTKAEGGDSGQAVTQGLLGAVGGAGKGVLLGAGLGAAAGAGAGAYRPELADRLRAAVHNAPGSQFGQRQVHALTGWTPEKGVGSIGLGHVNRVADYQAAAGNLRSAIDGKETRGLLQRAGDKVRGRGMVDSAHARFQNAVRAGEASLETERMGLTNIPGYMKSLKNNGVAKTLGAAAKDQWHGMGTGAKALTLGMPALELAGALKGPATDEQGRGRGERVGRAIAGGAAGTLLSPIPIASQMLVGGLANHAIGGIGKRLQRRPPPDANAGAMGKLIDSDVGQVVPSTTHVTDRAMGGGSAEGAHA